MRLKYLYLDGATFSFSIGEDRVAVATLLLPAFENRKPRLAGIAKTAEATPQ
jgi:hypothetical protein